METRIREMEKVWVNDKKDLTDKIETLTNENTELHHSLADLYMTFQQKVVHNNRDHSDDSGTGMQIGNSKLSNVPQQAFTKIEKRIDYLEKLCKVLVGEEENFELLHNRIDQTEQALRLLVDEMEGGMRQFLHANAETSPGTSPFKPSSLRIQVPSGLKANIESLLDQPLTGSKQHPAVSTVADDILSPETSIASKATVQRGANKVSTHKPSHPRRLAAADNFSSDFANSSPRDHKMGKILDNYIKNALEEKNQFLGEIQRVRDVQKKLAADGDVARAVLSKHEETLATMHRLLVRIEAAQSTPSEEAKDGSNKIDHEAQALFEARIAKCENVAGEVGAIRKIHHKVEELETALGHMRKNVTEMKERYDRRAESKDSKDAEMTENMARLAAGLRHRMGSVEATVKRLDGTLSSASVSLDEKVSKMRQDFKASLAHETHARTILEKELHYYGAAFAGGGSRMMAPAVISQSTPARPHADRGFGVSNKSPRQKHASTVASSYASMPDGHTEPDWSGAAGSYMSSPQSDEGHINEPVSISMSGGSFMNPIELRRSMHRRQEEEDSIRRHKEELAELEAKLAEEKALIQVEKEKAVQRELDLSHRRTEEAEAEKRRLEALAKEMEQVIATMKAAEAHKEIERLQAVAEREREKNQLILKAEAEAIENARKEVELREERRIVELTKELSRYKSEAEARDREREAEKEREREKARLAQELAEAEAQAERKEAERKLLNDREKEQAKETVAKQIAKFSADKYKADEEAKMALEAKERARLDAERELDRVKQKAEEDARINEGKMDALRNVNKEGAKIEAIKTLNRLKEERNDKGSPSKDDEDDDGATGTAKKTPFLSAADLAEDPVLAELDQEIRRAKQEKISTKKDIKRWMTQFEKENGCAPDTRAKESVKHLYLAHHRAVGILDKAEAAMVAYLKATK